MLMLVVLTESPGALAHTALKNKQTNRKAGEVTTITIMVIANAQRNRVKNQDIETLALY